MAYIPGQTVSIQVLTKRTSGEVYNPSSGPAAVLIRNGVDTAEPVTITQLGTGLFRATFTIPSAWSLRDVVELRVSATVDGVPGVSIVWSVNLEQADTLIVSPIIRAPRGAALVGRGIPLAVFRGESRTISITALDIDGSPVSLLGMTLRFQVETAAEPSQPVWAVTGGAIVLGGDDNEIATVMLDDADTDVAAGLYRWRLWDNASDQVILHGTLTILPTSEA